MALAKLRDEGQEVGDDRETLLSLMDEVRRLRGFVREMAKREVTAAERKFLESKALEGVKDTGECICIKCGLRHGGVVVGDPGF